MISICEGIISSEDYSKLRKDAGWFELDKDQMDKSLGNTSFMVYATDGDVVIAMARCISDQSYMTYIYDVVVDSRYRGRGIGKLVVNKIIDHYKQVTDCSMQIVLLAVDKSVEDFYKKIGFKKYPNLLNGSGMGMWINGRPY